MVNCLPRNAGLVQEAREVDHGVLLRHECRVLETHHRAEIHPLPERPEGAVPRLRTRTSIFDRGFSPRARARLGDTTHSRTVTRVGAALAPSRVPSMFPRGNSWRGTRTARMRNPCKAEKPSDGLEPSTPSLEVSEAVTAYTPGHARARLSCRSAVSGVTIVPARDRTCAG